MPTLAIAEFVKFGHQSSISSSDFGIKFDLESVKRDMLILNELVDGCD